MATLSSFSVDFRVRKSDGSFENFSPDKIITSCMNVGASFVQASQIASEIAESAREGVLTREIRKQVYEKLKAIDASIAEQYMYRLHMSVKTSKTTLEKFDVNKISESLVKETDLDKVYADLIARDVEKELAKMHLKHVTAPLIREIVNVKLLEHGLESARARYTRLGMPVYDVKQLIDNSRKINSGLQYNPETLHKLMADQISREYALLNVLPNDLADAHMSGKIHIHELDYFSIRPMGFCHDLRFFLKNGLKPDGVDKFTATSGPAKNPEVAFLHAAKLLAAAQSNCSGGQGLSYFNVYMAPYVRNLEYEQVRQLAQMFFYELSQMYAARGGQMVFSSIDLCLDIPAILSNMPAVQPGGVVGSGPTYGAYGKECSMLFAALIDVCSAGDYSRKLFSFPKLNIHLSQEDLRKPEMESILSLMLNHKMPYFILDRLYSSRATSYHSCAYSMPEVRENFDQIASSSYLRGGCMQAVTINLPQIAYEVNGNDERLLELLEFWIKRVRDVLLLKVSLIERNLDSGLLSFMGQKISEKERYLEPQKQNHVISFLGLNEMIKAHTDLDLSDPQGMEFGRDFIEKMSFLTRKLGEASGLNFVLAASPENSSASRMAHIDFLNHPKAVVNGDGEDVYYTNSFRPAGTASMALEDLIRVESLFSPLMNGGSLSSFRLPHYTPDTLSLNMARIVQNTDIQYFNFL